MIHKEGILCSFVCSRFWWVWISPGNFWILWWVQFKSVQVPWKFHTCTFSQNMFFVSLFLCCASTGASIGGIACTQLIQNTYLHSHTSGPFCFMVQQSVVYEVRCQIVGRIMRRSCTATDSFQWFSVIPFKIPPEVPHIDVDVVLSSLWIQNVVSVHIIVCWMFHTHACTPVLAD